MSRKLLKTLQSDEECHAQSAKFLPLYDLIWQFQQQPQVKKASNETSKFTELSSVKNIRQRLLSSALLTKYVE